MTQRTWGAPTPEQPRSPWSARRVVISAAAAVVLVAGGTTAVLAATNGGSANATTGGPGGGPFGGAGGPGFGLADALHGDFVVANGNGHTTERLQTGTVTAVSTTSITLRSSDGYTGTYVVDAGTSVDRGSDTINKVAAGHTATVIATLTGQQATANTIEDTTIDSRGGGFGGSPPAN